MTKNEYISKLENLIINRVKFHSPKVNGEIDYTLLGAIGIDARYPIFIFSRKLDKIYCKAFMQAKKKVDFNLILTEDISISKRKLVKLEKTYLIKREEIGSILASTLENLNINYVTHSDFKKEFEGEFLKVNGKIVKLDYLPYFYTGTNRQRKY